MNKPLSVTIILLLTSTILFAQEQRQLVQLLQKSKADSSRSHILYNLGLLYKNRRHSKSRADLDTAKMYFLKALSVSGKMPDSATYSKTNLWMNLGEISIDQQNLPAGKSYFTQSINYFHHTQKIENEAKALERLGNYLSIPRQEDMNIGEYFIRARILYEKLNKPDKVIYAIFLFALDQYYLDKPDSAEKICEQLIGKYKNTRFRNLEMAYYLLSMLNRNRGSFNKALYYALGSEKRMSLTNDTTRASVLYGEIAQVYQATGDMNNSIYYYKKCIFIREKQNFRQQFIFRTAGFVIQQLIIQKKAVEGLKYILGLEKRHPPDSEYEAAIVAQIKAICYDALNLDVLAEKNYQIMIKVFGADSSDVGQIAQLDIAKFYVRHNKFKQAANYINAIIPFDVQISKDLEWLRFEIDSAGGNFKSAIDHFQHFKTINDSVFTLSKTKQIQQLQVEYETEKKDKDIKFFKVERLAQQGKVQQANFMRNVTLAGIFVLILFLSFLYNSYRFKQRKNESLNLLVNEKDDLLIEKDSLLLQKQWLLKEIHHRVKNNLAIVMGLLNRQSAYIDNEVALTAIQNSQNRMRSIALIHQKLYQSECLDLVLMPDYIDELIGHLKDSFDLGNRIIFEKEIAELYLDVSQAVPLGLILNEAITNSIKYAYPDRVQGVISVKLTNGDNDENVLQIRDNGPGLKSDFDPQKIDSMGTNLMRGLSKQLGGALEMKDDHGVLIKVVFKTEVFVATSAAVN